MVFRYKVIIDFGDNESSEIGLIVASSYTEATSKIVNTYQEDLISIEKLKQITNDEIIVFPNEEEKVIDKIEDNYIW